LPYFDCESGGAILGWILKGAESGSEMLGCLSRGYQQLIFEMQLVYYF